MFNPLSKIVTIIEYLESLYIIALTFVYTWFIFYQFDDPVFFRFFNILGLFLFLLIPLQKMNTAYFFQGSIVTDQSLIIKRYTETFLTYDAIAFLSLIFITFNYQLCTTTKVLAIPLFLKNKNLL